MEPFYDLQTYACDSIGNVLDSKIEEAVNLFLEHVKMSQNKMKDELWMKAESDLIKAAVYFLFETQSYDSTPINFLSVLNLMKNPDFKERLHAYEEQVKHDERVSNCVLYLKTLEGISPKTEEGIIVEAVAELQDFIEAQELR